MENQAHVNASIRKIDRQKKAITVTKDFLIKAGQFGTPQFRKYVELMEEYPGYEIAPVRLARNESKQSYGKLTYAKMEDFITGYESDENRTRALAEYEDAKAAVQGQKGAYLLVRKWFLEKYKDELARMEAEDSAAKKQRREAHYLYHPACVNG